MEYSTYYDPSSANCDADSRHAAEANDARSHRVCLCNTYSLQMCFHPSRTSCQMSPTDLRPIPIPILVPGGHDKRYS